MVHRHAGRDAAGQRSPLGHAAPKLLDALGIEAVELARLEDVGPLVDQAARSCFSSGQVVALVVSTLLSGGKR